MEVQCDVMDAQVPAQVELDVHRMVDLLHRADSVGHGEGCPHDRLKLGSFAV